MTIDEAINRIDSLIPNAYVRGDKIAWLSTLDGTIKKEIIQTHKKRIRHPAAETLTSIPHYRWQDDPQEIPQDDPQHYPVMPYTEETPADTLLLAPYPYDNIYLYYLEMQIDYYNSEIDKYNNAKAMFDEAYSAFRNFWNRTHLPKPTYNRYF